MKWLLSLTIFWRAEKRRLKCSGLLCCMLLAGCGAPNDAERILTTYQNRLANILNEETEPPRFMRLPVMPRASEVRSPIDDVRISLLDSMRLDRCRAGQVIAQRNSALGRLQSPSARLRYEIDSIQAFAECRESAVAENERIDQMLADAIVHKTLVLPQWIDHVLTQSDEFRHALRAARDMHSVEESGGFEETLAALEYLTTIFSRVIEDPTQPVDLGSYNDHFRTLAQSDFLPRHWRTQQRLAGWLDELNSMLENGGNKIGCHPPARPQRAEYLHNVMLNIYAAEIQPLLARWRGYHQQLAPLLLQLSDMTEHAEWQAYIQELAGPESHAEEMHRLTIEHAQLWQQILAQCQISVGRFADNG